MEYMWYVLSGGTKGEGVREWVGALDTPLPHGNRFFWGWGQGWNVNAHGNRWYSCTLSAIVLHVLDGIVCYQHVFNSLATRSVQSIEFA